MFLTDPELTGQARTHIVDLQDPPCAVHLAAAAPLQAMRAAALAEGIDLAPVSSFRDFSAQLRIWNDKFQGRRPLYNRAGQLLDPSTLTPSHIVDAILAWSALPGASRHHWGTEVDLIDRAALSPGQKVQLLPEEYSPTGPFARLTAWLDRNMQTYGFFRPYREDRGGVAPEPWHLSYAPASEPALEQLTTEVLRRLIEGTEISGKEILLGRLPEIHQRYVLNIVPRQA